MYITSNKIKGAFLPDGTTPEYRVYHKEEEFQCVHGQMYVNLENLIYPVSSDFSEIHIPELVCGLCSVFPPAVLKLKST